MHDRRTTRTPTAWLRVLMFLVTFGIGSVALAADTTEPPQAQVEPSKTSNPNKLICKRETTTGSFIPKKTCKTRAQVDKEQAANKRWMEENHTNSSWSTTSTEGGMVIEPPHP